METTGLPVPLQVADVPDELSFAADGYGVVRMVREFCSPVPLRRPDEELDALIVLSAVRQERDGEPTLRIRAEIIDA